MPVVIDLRGVVENLWLELDDEQPLERRNHVIMSAARIRRTWEKPESVDRIAGVTLNADESIQEIAGWLPHLALVCLQFENFADGRAFSQARLLRERYGFRGIIRARGQVIRDQLAFMQRCGFNQFQLAPGEDSDEALHAFDDIGFAYQAEVRQAV